MSEQTGWFIGALVAITVLGEFAPTAIGMVVVLVAIVLALRAHRQGLI